MICLSHLLVVFEEKTKYFAILNIFTLFWFFLFVIVSFYQNYSQFPRKYSQFFRKYSQFPRNYSFFSNFVQLSVDESILRLLIQRTRSKRFFLSQKHFQLVKGFNCFLLENTFDQVDIVNFYFQENFFFPKKIIQIKSFVVSSSLYAKFLRFFP